MLGTEEVTTPLTQFTQNILGTFVVMVKPKMKTTQTKMTTQQNTHTALFLPTRWKGVKAE